MAFTFGGATGDGASYPTQVTYGATGGTHFFCGWWLPTTLTAGRHYFGNANVYGLQVGPTTSELRFVTDHATTDSAWDTTGAGIAINNWYYLAALAAINDTGPTLAVRIWRGSVMEAPVELTVANTTAAVGAATGNATMAAGNRGAAGTVAFQGDIEGMFTIGGNVLTTGNDWYSQTASGVITNECAEYTYRTWVLPWWYRNGGLGFRQVRGSSVQEQSELPLRGDTGMTSRTGTGSFVITNNSAALTITGAVASQNSGPRPWIIPLQMQYRRR